MGEPRARRHGAPRWWPTGIALALVVAATLWPVPTQAPQSAQTPLACLLCGEAGLADFLANILLFLPLGVALLERTHRWPLVLLMASATSAGVELLQFTTIPGRDAALGDLVANTLGGALGALLGKGWRALVWPTPAVARRLALGWGMGIAALLVAGSVLLQPSLPGGQWYGQWATEIPEAGWFDGRIDAAWLGTMPLSHWRLEDTDAHRRELARGPVRLAARIHSGHPSDAPRRIVGVASDQARFLELGQDGRALRFALRTRGSDLRLRAPTFRLGGALPAEAGAAVTIEGQYSAGAIRLRTAPGRWWELELRAWDAWMLIWPWEISERTARVSRTGWVLLLLAPLLWWGWPGLRPRLAPNPEGVERGGEVG